MKPEDIQDLKQLIEFLKENQVAEFDLDRGDLKIRLKFNPVAAAVAAQAAGSLPVAIVQAGAPIVAHPGPVAVSEPDPEAGLHMVKSPIVGTFYGSPSPGAAPFVTPGDHVQKGQVICIVEAMKLMNEIESDASGEIVRCLVVNGQPIEYGQALFAIRPS